jgi:hypothetical protein
MNSIRICALTALAFSVLASSSMAVINAPPGLQAGDKFHLMFVTSGVTMSLSSNPPAAHHDGFVFNEAVANGLLNYDDQYVDWYALISHWWLPTPIGAIDRFNPSYPVYRLDGVKIADDGADLYDGFLQNPINVGPDLSTVDHFVWTGSEANGTPAINNAYLNNGFVNARIGQSAVTFSNWIAATDFPWSAELHLYAFSSLITVVPEPGTLALGVLALTATMLTCRRRTHANCRSGR